MKTRNKMIFKKGRQKFPKAVGFMMLFAGLLGLQSCNDFLDVVPDNVATLDQAFTLRNEAEKYLFTCYSYLPINGDPLYNIGMLSGDEMWIPPNDLPYTSFANRIASGLQRTSEPYMNAWDGNYQGAGYDDNYKMWAGIRHCNVFLENLEDRSKVADISEAERLKWIAEAKFLKAYYHFYLMNIYGPIPIMDKAIPVDAPLDELYVSRQPIDDVVNYIVDLLDDAIEGVDPLIVDRKNDLGRITKPIAASVKAQVLLTAASPLFNGNTEMANFKTKNGVDFFNQNYDNEKWKLAADAALEAIDFAEAAGNTLHVFTTTPSLSQRTKNKLSIIGAVTERASKEVIWHNTHGDSYWMQVHTAWPLIPTQPDYTARKTLSVTMKMAELFYTKNGVPITEDKTLDFTNPTTLRVAEASEGSDIKEGQTTARLNFDRELRFYADLAFDRSVNYFESNGADETGIGDAAWLKAKFNDPSGSNDVINFNVTGYYPKKILNYRYTYTVNGGDSYTAYYWPEIRLPELYLIYAEALNEYSGPSQPVYDYIDIIRTRAGLQGVKSAWSAYSNQPGKPLTQEGLRDIIQRERTIELAFEGKRFWDLRRWKKAVLELNKPVRGWNYKGATEASYYQINTLFQQRFVAPRDYFWPLSEQTLRQNPNLVQNPGW